MKHDVLKTGIVHVYGCLSSSPCVQGFKSIWWLENMIEDFLSNTTHLIVLLCICFRTNNFVLMCLCNVLHMYLIKLIFPDLYIGTKIKRSQLNLNMWYFFVSMLFYIFQHGLIPVSIFVLHLFFLLFRVLLKMSTDFCHL